MFPRKTFRIALAGALAAVAIPAMTLADSPDGLWINKAGAHDASRGEAWFTPGKHVALETDFESLKDLFTQAPSEEQYRSGATPLQIWVPNPDGGYERFEIWEYQVLHPDLAAKFPQIRTWQGNSLEGTARTIHLDVTELGFKAQVLGPGGRWFIEPQFRNNMEAYAAYYTADWPHIPVEMGTCQTPAIDGFGEPLPDRDAEPLPTWDDFQAMNGGVGTSTPFTPANRRDYVIAVSTSGEYTATTGGTVGTALSAVTTVINKNNAVYERDLNVRLILHPNTSNVLYTNSATDPYNNNVSGAQVNTLESTVAANVTAAPAVDLSHLFVTGTGGGIAGGIGNVCIANDSGGMSSSAGLGGPTSDPFAIDFVAHELGHQFGGRHTFANADACGGMDPPANVEPGSATTIMGYAGICASDNIQANSDPNFHVDSIIRMKNYLDTRSCQDTTTTGNTVPTATAGSNFSIPRSTPFTLTGSGTDPDAGQTLTYSWESRDQQATTSTASSADNGTKPLWRSFPPTTNNFRHFPRLSDTINNTTTLGEMLPTQNRASMDFTLTVRDNRAGGGGVGISSMALNVVAAAGPFAVTAPNTAVTWTTSPQTVTWNVASTTAAPISTANVNILLSTDGGLTFPITLLANTPNDGTQSVALPSVNSTTCRVKVEAVGNVYWDMSNANFTINFAGGAPVVTNVTSPAANGTYTSGTIPVEVTFNAAVTVTGTPRISLNTTPGRFATYASGTGTTTLTFNYAVQAGDASPDLDYTDANALTLNGGTINATVGGTPALLALAAPGATGSLGFNKNIVIGMLMNIANGSLTEGDTGAANMSIPVTLSATNTSGSPITANYTITPGTATATDDYNPAGGVVSIPNGQSTANILIPIVGDHIFEGNETFTVTLSGATGATIVGATATGTINNNDHPRRLFGINMESESTSDNEGFYGYDPAAPFSELGYFVNSGIAAAANSDTWFVGGDFAGTDRSVFYTMTYSLGGTETLYRINTATGATISTSTVTMPNPGTGAQYYVGMKWDPSLNAGAGAMVVVTADTTGAMANQRRCRISTLNLTTGVLTMVTESQTGVPQTATNFFMGIAIPPGGGGTYYTVQIPNSLGSTTAKVLYSVASGSGAMGSLGNITVSGSATALITYFGDLAFDPEDSSLYFSGYSSPSFANILYRLGTPGAPGVAATAVQNLDILTPSSWSTLSGFAFARFPAGTPTLSVSNPAAITEGNSGTQNVTFSVTKTGTNAANITVDWDLGGSVKPSDVTSAFSGSLTFAPGGTASQNVVVTVSGDTTWETNEQLALTLSNNSPNSLISTATGASTINNDDAPVGDYAYGTDNGLAGMFLFDPSNIAATASRSLGTALPGGSKMGGTFVGTDASTFYLLGFDTAQLHRVNTTTGAVTSSTVTGFAAGHTQLIGIAYDPVATVTRVLTRNGTTGAVRLATINVGTGALTPAGADLTGIPANTIPLGIAVSPGGVVYTTVLGTTGADADRLCSINTGTNVVTVIGNLGVDVPGTLFSDLAFRPSSGVLYWTSFTNPGVQTLFTINTGTGAATAVANLQDPNGVTPGIVQASAFGFTPLAAGPTISLASAAGDPVNGAIIVNATLSAAPDGGTFVVGDVSATNANVSGFGGSGTAWSWTLTPIAQGSFSCQVGASTFTSSGQNNTASNVLSRVFDSVVPTISLASGAPNPTNGAVTVTATLSEAPGAGLGGFTSADVTPTNANVSAFSGSGINWSWTLTPIAQGAFSCVVNAGTFADAAGNPNTISNVYSNTFDNVAPTITLTSGAPNPTNGAVTVTATLSEVPGAGLGGFTAADVTPTNANVSDFGGSGTSWSWTLTPIAQGAFSCVVNAGTFADAAGNANTISNVYANVFDNVAPTINLTSGAPNPVNGFITVTATLSEASTNFTDADISTTNGTVSLFAGGGASYSWRLTPGVNGAFSCQVDAAQFTDAANNQNTASNVLSRTFDGTPPTISLSAPPADPVNGAVTVTATLSEAPAAGTFVIGDVSSTNASVSAFNLVGTTATWTLAPSAEGLFSCQVDAGAFTDTATNGNTASNVLSRTFDNTAPTIALSAPPADPVNGAITVTATLSEAPAAGTFVVADVTPTNANVSAFNLVGTTATWTLTPIAQGAFSCIVNANRFNDDAGNNNTASNLLSRGFDSVSPTVSMFSAIGDPTGASPIPVTVTFSEPVFNFVLGDIVVTNATTGNFAGGPAVYTFNLFPSSAGLVTANIAAGVANDAATNPNTAATQFSRTYNNVNPTVSMNSAAANPTNTSPIPVTVTFSAPVSGFISGDIVPGNATVSGFGGTGASYSFNLIPDGQGTVTADIAAGVAQDGASNPNTAAAQFSRVFDTVAPTATLASVASNPVNGAIAVTVTLSESSSNFVSGDITPTNAAVSGFAGSGDSYSFTLTPSAQGAFSAGVSAGAFTDAANNASTAASNVLSRIFDSIAPVSAVSAVADPTRVGTALSLGFTAADASAVTTALWVRAPGSGVFVDSGLAEPGNSGTFSFTTTVGANGLYEFAALATDAAGNVETLPGAADTSVLLNTVENGAFTQTTATASDTLTFPMTDDLDMFIELTDAVISASVTVSRVAPYNSAPAGLLSGSVINEHLTITQAGLGGAFSAELTWSFDPDSAVGLIGAIEFVYAYEAGVQIDSYPVTPVGSSLVVPGITTFSDWYAGNGSTMGELDWMLLEP